MTHLTIAPPPISKTEEVLGVKGISAKRMQRIKEVMVLYESGMKIDELAVRYNINPRMIDRDLQDGRRLDREIPIDVDQTAVVKARIRFYETSIRAALRDYQTFRSENGKIGAMRTAAELTKQYTEFLQRVGLLKEVPKQILIGETSPFDDDEFTLEFELLVMKALGRGVNLLGLR
jgi:Mor family transcriptional regulator